jgi:hypothetical protein
MSMVVTSPLFPPLPFEPHWTLPLSFVPETSGRVCLLHRAAFAPTDPKNQNYVVTFQCHSGHFYGK